MKQSVRRANTTLCRTANHVISRRFTLRSSGLAVLGLVSHTAFAQTGERTTEARGSGAEPSKQMQERAQRTRAIEERMRNASSMEERQQIMSEQMAWQRQQVIEGLKEQLRLSDQEWSVVKPRLQAVYDLANPQPPMMGRNELPETEVGQRSRELREVLNDDKAAVDQVKAKLTALRAAKVRVAQELVKARQNLRQVMNLRQEALLVLNGLLD